MEGLKNTKIIEVKKLVKKVKCVFVWCNWHIDDGDYFKVEKKYFLEVLKQYENKIGIEFDYRYNKDEDSLYLD
jgi:hypothetical protein